MGESYDISHRVMNNIIREYNKTATQYWNFRKTREHKDSAWNGGTLTSYPTAMIMDDQEWDTLRYGGGLPPARPIIIPWLWNDNLRGHSSPSLHPFLLQPSSFPPRACADFPVPAYPVSRPELVLCANEIVASNLNANHRWYVGDISVFLSGWYIWRLIAPKP